jgi:class 3 adenylate cyclase
MTRDAAGERDGFQASDFRQLFEDERMRSARRVSAIRALMVPAFLLLNVWFGLFAGYPAPVVRIPALVLYTILAIALYFGTRRDDSLCRHSWYALPLLDLPMIFLMQYQATFAATERMPVIATFTFSVFLFVVVASQLSLRRLNIYATAATAALLELVLLARADIPYVMFDVLVVAFSTAALAGYLSQRNVTLLRSALAERSQTDRLSRYFSPAVVDRIMSGEADDLLKTRRREITAVFVDLRGFTGFTETAEPEEVISVLREYHTDLGHAIMAYAGTIEHFAGDGVMILFNDPVPVEDHELQAIRMALRMRDSMAVLAQVWKKRGYAIGFGIGIAGGFATIGTIGFEGRRDFGAIGTVINLCARLCGEASNGQILISPRILSKTDSQIEAEPIGELSLKGFQRPVQAYNVLRLRP